MTLSKEQFFKNSAWTFAELTLFPLLVIIATPVFIKHLGISQYGLWMLIATITQGVNILNIGLGETTIRLVAQLRAEKKEELIHKVFGYNFSLSLLLCLAAVVLGGLLCVTNFISLFYKTSNYTAANTVLFLACVSSGVKFVEIALLAVFKAYERFDIKARLSLISKNSVIIGSLIIVLLHGSLAEILLFTVGLNVANVLLQLLVLKRFNRRIPLIPKLRFFREKPEGIYQNFWYWLQSSIALVGFLTDKMAVAWLTDIKTVGYYCIASMIGANIHNFFLAFGGFIFPRVSYKLALGNNVQPLYYVSRSLIALPGWLLTIGLLTLGDPLFRLWLGNETYLNSVYFIKLYLVFEAGMLLIIVPFYFINGSQKVRLNSVFEIIIRASHFTAMLLGYYFAGVNGIIYGLILSTLINVPIQYFYFHIKIIDVDSGLSAIKVILPVFFVAGLVFCSSLFIQAILLLAFIISAKLIYFDPVRPYASRIFSGSST